MTNRHIAIANSIVASVQPVIRTHRLSNATSSHTQLRRARVRLQLAVRICAAARRQHGRASALGQQALVTIQAAQTLSRQARGWAGFSSHWNCQCGSCTYSSWQ